MSTSLLAACAPSFHSMRVEELPAWMGEYVEASPRGVAMTIRVHVPTLEPTYFPLRYDRDGTPAIRGEIISADLRYAMLRRLSIDTGGAFYMSMDERDAAKFGVLGLADAGLLAHTTASGVVREPLGVAGGVRAGPLVLRPVPVNVRDRDGLGVYLGEEFVDRLGGLIIDTSSGRVILLPPTEDETVTDPMPEGWMELPWTRSRRDGVRTVQVRLAGRTYRAVLDTGADSELFTVVELDGVVDARTMRGRAWGFPFEGYVGRLETTLELGALRLDGVRVSGIAPGSALSPHLDVIVGMRILKRFPIWFDPQNDVVRIWVQEGPPEFPFDVAG